MMLAAVSEPLSSDLHGRILKLHRNAVFGEVSNRPPQSQSRTIPPIRPNGTDDARKYLTSGVAAHLASRANARGGARNHSDRESHFLTASHVSNLTAAARHADAIGLPLNRMLTIHWEAAGVPLEAMPKATGHFTDLLTKALARAQPGSATAWLWTHENGDGKGGHCHLLAHVPPALVRAVTGLQKGWLRRISGNPYRATVIFSKPIGGRLGLETGNPDLHAINLESVLSYVLKGAGEQAAARFGLDLIEPGGRIIGKRCGTSQNIGAKARKAGGDGMATMAKATGERVRK